MTHDAYVKMMKSTLSGLVVKSAVAWIAGQAAFFALGPVQTILTLIISKIVEIIFNHTEMAVFLNYIDTRVDAQGKEFSEAAIANELAQKSGTPEQKEQARKRLMDATKSFVMLRN